MLLPYNKIVYVSRPNKKIFIIMTLLFLENFALKATYCCVPFVKACCGGIFTFFRF